MTKNIEELVTEMDAYHEGYNQGSDQGEQQRHELEVENKELREAIQYLLDTECGEWVNPSPQIDAYGRHECGCSWDSGPYTTYCREHDPIGRLEGLIGGAND